MGYKFNPVMAVKMMGAVTDKTHPFLSFPSPCLCHCHSFAPPPLCTCTICLRRQEYSSLLYIVDTSAISVHWHLTVNKAKDRSLLSGLALVALVVPTASATFVGTPFLPSLLPARCFWSSSRTRQLPPRLSSHSAWHWAPLGGCGCKQ